MLARFFIDRPIFAWVISIVIVLGGLFALTLLPIAQYPEITPPTVEVRCTYPGANARVVQDTVAAPIEEKVNGVEGAIYMSSTSANDGSYVLTVTFELGVNLNMAQVLVQNRVAQAMPKLPQEVQATGVTVNKKSPAILLVVNLFSDRNPRTGAFYYDQLYLSNYATIQIKDELARLKGVGDISLLGQQDYSMRVWLDPEKLSSRDMTAGDVANALKEQNVQVAAGQVGAPPVPRGQDFQYTMSTLGRLTEPSQFGAIVVKTGKKAEPTYLRDVARVELGAQNQNTTCRLDGKPSVGLAVFQLPGSNALDVAEKVKKTMRELKTRFPANLEYGIVYDTTPFIEESVYEVFKTLIEAIILVALVVLFFLQDWKAVLLPLIDVGVSLVGTLAIMKMMGFTLNTLTMFGLVLAIGIVVDDAIMVLENIERWLAKGLPVREATIKAMDEITGPIIGVTLVLCSVFLPSALLIGGISGQFYQQFALTIAASMILSAINAMTMTPARAGAIFGHRTPPSPPTPLPPGARGESRFPSPLVGEGSGVRGDGHEAGHEALPWWIFGVLFGVLTVVALGPTVKELLTPALLGLLGPEVTESGTFGSKVLALMTIVFAFLPGALGGGVAGWFIIAPVNQALGVFFRGFNRVFDALTAAYGRAIGGLLRASAVVLVVYGGLLALTAFGFTHLPTGFIPSQDQGYLVADLQLPDSASLERTVEVMEQLEEIAKGNEAVGHVLAVPGQSFVLNSVSSNLGGVFIVLKPFHERHKAGMGADAVMADLRRKFYAGIQSARISVFGAPAVQGLGNTGGFKLMVEDRGGLPLEMLQGQADAFAEAVGERRKLVVGVFNSFRANTPQLYADVNREKCKSMGVPLNEVFSALQMFLGGYYVNDFNAFGRTWQVNVQADAGFRLSPETVKLLKVRNNDGDMIPLGTVIDIRDSSGPLIVTRYNTFPAATINGSPRPGVSTGTVIATMERMARKDLPTSMVAEWTELTYLEKQAGGTAIVAFLGAVVLVFLVLAAQYESWSLPLTIILVVPMCLLCAMAGVALAKMDMNIFVQIGFVVLVGLASKNAILIVEFAKERLRAGAARFEAAVEASVTRLRPIVMTSLAFILGVMPLMFGSGAGAEMRRTLGVAVFSGMLGVTLFGIFLTPVFYYVIVGLTGRGEPEAAPAAEAPVIHAARAQPPADAITKLEK